MAIKVDNNVKNQKLTPALYADVFANIPAAGQPGRLFLSTDTDAIYRDNGTSWDLFISQTNVPSGLLPLGLAGQYLRVNSTSPPTALEYFTFDSTVINNTLGYTPLGSIGSFTTNYLPKVSAGNLLTNSNVYDDGTNVGVGTNTPASKFTVQGAIRSDNGVTGYMIMIHDSGFGKIQTYTNTKLYLNELGNDIILGSTGNVSVGTTTAQAKFHVVGNTFFDGNVGIGTNSLTGFNFRIEKEIGGASTAVGSYVTSNVNNTAFLSAWGFATNLGTNASVTSNEIVHFRAAQKTFGAGSIITTQIGFASGSTLTGATSNYSFYSSLASGTNRWNLYMVGTARNYLAGVLTIGTTAPNASAMVQIDSTTQGFLPPRMTSAQRTAIATPAVGLVVYQTDGGVAEGLYVYKSTGWSLL